VAHEFDRHRARGRIPAPNGDAQSGVTELTLNFDYLATSLEWLLLSPGSSTGDAEHTRGLYRNYFGQDIDDNFIADNE